MGQRGKGKVSGVRRRGLGAGVNSVQRVGGSRDNNKGWTDFNMATATNKAFIDYYKVGSLKVSAEHVNTDVYRSRVFCRKTNGRRLWDR